MVCAVCLSVFLLFDDNRFKINRFIRLKKILHKYVLVNLNYVLDLLAATSLGVVVRDLSIEVFTRSPSEPIYHRVGWGTGWGGERMSSLGGRYRHRSDIDTLTHNTRRANTMSRSQWSKGNGHFFWPSLPFATTELGGVVVKFYSIHQICSSLFFWLVYYHYLCLFFSVMV